jgi:hypothetical protein
MIEVELEFRPGSLKDAVRTLLSLPDGLRPSHHSFGESERKYPIRSIEFADSVSETSPGPYLTGEHCCYHFSVAAPRPTICRGEISVEPDMARQLLLKMAALSPIFGFACAPGERRQRNHVTVQQGVNSIENWVGRDPEKYVPGIYWLTLLPNALLEKHGIPISVLEALAQEHISLAHEGHLFRFYERPEDWSSTPAVAELYRSLPGLFDVEKIRPRLLIAKNFLELNSVLREWR